jgi:hypothetical protein
MIWSFTDSRTFAKCQRRWYFDAVRGYWAQKDPLRWEAYLLSKLQTVSAWRGQIVDLAITTTLVPSINSRQPLSLSRCLARARAIFDAQRAFAMRHRLREANMVPSQHKDDFAAFLPLEYGGRVEETELAQAWAEIEQAITNLFGMDSLLGQLQEASLCVAQRALTFEHEGVSVKAVPDLIAFFLDRPPLIVDWKVHSFGTKDYWLQLVTYALALTRCTIHRDFGRVFRGCEPTAVRLLEVQLLTNQLRDHTLDEDDVGEVEDLIAESAARMTLALDGRKHPEVRPTDFPVTSGPENCEGCPFRRPCWEEQP